MATSCIYILIGLWASDAGIYDLVFFVISSRILILLILFYYVWYNAYSTFQLINSDEIMDYKLY